MTLVCHVILEDNVINKSCDFMVESPSWQVIIVPSLLAIAILLVEI